MFFYKPPEIAILLRIALPQAQELCRSGRIPAMKVGGLWRIPHDELVLFMSDQGITITSEGLGTKMRSVVAALEAEKNTAVVAA